MPPQANNSEAIVYLNGRILPASEAHLAIFDAGVVMGATVTEMTRTFRRQPFRLREHLDRLFRSLRYVRFAIQESKEDLAKISHELIAHNSEFLPGGGELGVIQFVTAGEVAAYAGFAPAADGAADRPAAVGAACTVCIHTFPLCWKLWAEKMRRGTHLITPSVRHVPPQCVDPKIKHRSRMHYYLADREARLVDPDASALLLDLEGNVTETSAANYLFVERGTIVSPPTRNTLPGVSRATVIELAAKLGIGFVERESQIYHAINADEAFLASTPYCLMPVTKINGIPIGDGKPGPIFRRLLSAWSQLVGVDIDRQIVDGASEQRPSSVE
jgi:branched-chain amino acid aminotransferase